MTPYAYIGPYVYVRVLPQRGLPHRWGFWGRIPETGPKAIRVGESLGQHPAFPLRSPLKGAGVFWASAPYLMGQSLKLNLKGWPNRPHPRYVTGFTPLRPVTGICPVTASQPLRLFRGGCRLLRTLRVRTPFPPLKPKAVPARSANDKPAPVQGATYHASSSIEAQASTARTTSRATGSA